MLNSSFMILAIIKKKDIMDCPNPLQVIKVLDWSKKYTWVWAWGLNV